MVVDTPVSMFLFVKGRGTVVTGRIEQGTIKVGEDIEILGLMQVIHISKFTCINLPLLSALC